MVELQFRIKICGVTSVADAQMIADCGADAIGLNFYSESPRYVTLQKAEEIVNSLSQEIKKVGVFVNSAPDYVDRTASQLGLDAVQLHGDESIEFIAALHSPIVIRAFRIGRGGMAEIQKTMQRCRDVQLELGGILVDAFLPGQYGGTGVAVDWQQIQAEQGLLFGLPLILAGGLRLNNIEQAIEAVRPSAVDTASGVETEPGVKEVGRVRSFVTAANKAFQRLEKYRK